jgi:hypothetical protein
MRGSSRAHDDEVDQIDRDALYHRSRSGNGAAASATACTACISGHRELSQHRLHPKHLVEAAYTGRTAITSRGVAAACYRSARQRRRLHTCRCSAIFPSLIFAIVGLFAHPISNFRLKPWLSLTDSRGVTTLKMLGLICRLR